jgi:hydroxymethylpyrimidine/phosphomethylpyrimidine kinase
MVKVALTIAGSDSGAGAGIQADLKTFAAHGVYGATAITAITAQNTTGVFRVLQLPIEMVGAQIEAVAGDFTIDAVKTGMLASAAVIEAVAASIESLQLPRLVVDPVMIAKGGHSLVTGGDDEMVSAIKSVLLPLALVVTPNAAEASRLAGIPVSSLHDAREAAKRIHACGPGAVLVKGGHLENADAVDLLYDGHEFLEFAGPRVVTRNTHGTGCTFAAALAANLALGDRLQAAAERAKRYVAGALRHGLRLGHGHGPLDHFWERLEPSADRRPHEPGSVRPAAGS